MSDMKIDLTEDQFQDLINLLDTNRDGKISFIEFDNYLRKVDVNN